MKEDLTKELFQLVQEVHKESRNSILEAFQTTENQIHIGILEISGGAFPGANTVCLKCTINGQTYVREFEIQKHDIIDKRAQAKKFMQADIIAVLAHLIAEKLLKTGFEPERFTS